MRIGRSPGDRVYCSEKELRSLWGLYIKQDFTDMEHLKTVLRHFLFMCFYRTQDKRFFCTWLWKHGWQYDLFLSDQDQAAIKLMVRVSLGASALKLIADEGTSEGLMFRPLSEQRMNKNLKEIAKMAGINKPLTNHSGRHTFATLFIERTFDVATLQKLLGHSRIEETMFFSHSAWKKKKLKIK